MLHKSEEDYIKFIYEASTSNKTHLSLKDIASYFSYREQSVNEMIKKLQKKRVCEIPSLSRCNIT
jgi:Mn-dependent DtxR family transcriptional regulator